MSNQGAGESALEKPTYLDVVNALTSRFPILFYITDFIETQLRRPIYPVRAAVLEFRDGEVRKIDFDGKDRESGYENLRTYLSSSSSSDCRHRVYLLEDLDASFIELLGANLNVDGTVFASQIRDTHFSGGWEHGHQPKLPSFQDPQKSFTLRYYEARYFDDPGMPDFSASVRTTGNLSRRILLGRGQRSKFEGSMRFIRERNYAGHVGLIRRNTSFWSQVEIDGSWNGVILLDPSIEGRGSIFSGAGSTQQTRQIPNHVYQGGYRDFSPWPTSPDLVISDIRGPRRISLLDDICYYWTKIATKDEISLAIGNPYHSTLFLRNIIASIWMNAIEYIQAILSELETKLWQIERMIAPDLSHAEKDFYVLGFSTALNEVNTMRRRLNWYVAEMKSNCEVLGTNPDFLSDDPKRNADFVAIYHRLVNYQNWAEKLMNVISTQVNLMETKKSIADSKSLARLTVLGFFFLPLSFVATFFSMGGDFSVGQSGFWVYFAVSVPLTLLVYLVAFGKWRVWWNIAVEREWIKKHLIVRE